MWLHFLALGALLLSAALPGGPEGREARKPAAPLVVPCLLFGAMAALRAPTVGNDTIEYHRVFKEIVRTHSLPEALALSRFESGYVVLNYALSRATDNFNILLLIIAACYLASVALFIHRYARSNSLAVLLAFGMSVFYDFMITARQGLAVALFLLAVPALLERRALRYILLIILASQFHAMAIVMLLAYPLPAIRLDRFGGWLRLGAVVVVAMCGLSWLLVEAAGLSGYYGHYLTSEYAEGGVRAATIMGAAVRLLMIAVAVPCGWNAAIRQDSTGTTGGLLALAGADLGIVLVSLGFNLVDRFEMYLTLPFVVGLTNVIARGRGPVNAAASFYAVLLAVAHMTVILLYRPGWSHIFPYQTVFQGGPW